MGVLMQDLKQSPQPGPRVVAAFDHWSERFTYWLKALPSAYIVGIVQIVMGIFVFASPERGVVSLVDNLYHIPIGLYGIVCIVCGILLLGKLTLTQLLAFTVPVLMYIVAALIYSIDNPNVSPIVNVLYTGFYAFVLRMFAREAYERK